MRINLYLILGFFVFQQGFGQLRPEIQNLVTEISDYGGLTSEFIGYAGNQSPQYLRCMLLDSIATESELIFLTEHKSPVVRCAAFPSLCKKNVELSTQILYKHLFDNKIVLVQSGCVGSDRSVADDFIGSYIYILTEKDSVIPTKNREYKTKLDHLILENSLISLRYKTHLIRTLELNKKNYAIVKKIALQAKEPEAIIALAKYHNKKDKNIIVKAFGNEKLEIGAIRATKEFPESDFFPFLVKIFESDFVKSKNDYDKWRLLYQTIAKFPNEPKTIELFERTFTRDKELRKPMEEYLWMAITKYPNPNFEIFKPKLNVDENNIFLLEERDFD